ncbi:MAG: HAD family hydrolase [Burkholderiales bacterium]
MGINKTYKLYVFDLDGTVADTKVDMARALQAAVTAAGFEKPSIDEVVSAIGQGAQKAVQKLTGLGEEEVGSYVDIFMEKYDEFCCDNVTLYPGVKELLYSLKAKGARIALVTMKFKSAVHKILKCLDIDIFDAVISFEDAPKRKPDPESLLMLMEKFGASASETLMIGDSITDLKYARAAGVDACLHERGYGRLSDLVPLKPEYMVKGFFEF